MVEIPRPGVKELKIMDQFAGGCQCGRSAFRSQGPSETLEFAIAACARRPSALGAQHWFPFRLKT
jgi:hypothetical protein